jgi:hypothetical protein
LALSDEYGNLRQESFGIVEFSASNIADVTCPVFSNYPGFISGGRTLGDARGWTILNRYSSDLQDIFARIIGEAGN